jgi:hypothetical protein
MSLLTTGVSCGFSRRKAPRCFAFQPEVSLVHTFFTATDFVPTKWSTAEEKASFGNNLLHFMMAGFVVERFTEKLYTRLSMCFGHIAHYDRHGFADTWFDSPESIAAFVNHLMQWPCHGDPGYTFSDVEQAVQREVAKLNLVATVNEAAASSIRARELALLDALESKYRRDTVIPMPTAIPAESQEPEQLPLIA